MDRQSILSPHLKCRFILLFQLFTLCAMNCVTHSKCPAEQPVPYPGKMPNVVPWQRWVKWKRTNYIFALTPISVDIDIAPAARNPATGNPDSARPRWVGPVSRYPDIPTPVPAVVSRHPDPSRM